MRKAKTSLFTIDLKIDAEILKVQVYQSDSLNDLILRLRKTNSKGKNKYPQEKVKYKLQTQFGRICQNEKVSGKIRDKLTQFLQESKLIIIGISQNTRQEQKLNQTPFNILDENSQLTNQFRQEKGFQYLNGAKLKKNYGGSQRQGMIISNNMYRKVQNVLQDKINYYNPREEGYHDYKKKASNIDREIQKIYKRENVYATQRTSDNLYDVNSHQRTSPIIRKQQNPLQKQSSTFQRSSPISHKENTYTSSYSLHSSFHPVQPVQRNKSQYTNYNQNYKTNLGNLNFQPSKSENKLSYCPPGSTTQYNYDYNRHDSKSHRKFNYLCPQGQ